MAGMEQLEVHSKASFPATAMRRTLLIGSLVVPHPLGERLCRTHHIMEHTAA